MDCTFYVITIQIMECLVSVAHVRVMQHTPATFHTLCFIRTIKLIGINYFMGEMHIHISPKKPLDILNFYMTY